MEEVVKKRMISLPEVKEILSEGNPESLDQIQRWTHDYVSKFAKISSVWQPLVLSRINNH